MGAWVCLSRPSRLTARTSHAQVKQANLCAPCLFLVNRACSGLQALKGRRGTNLHTSNRSKIRNRESLFGPTETLSASTLRPAVSGCSVVPMGVRFGSSEIYNILLKHFAREVEDALCIGRKREQDVDEVVVLFLKMSAGQSFSSELSHRIQAVVKRELSARHVPKIIDECPEIPVTTNGKKVEGAVKKILSGLNIKTSASV